MRIARKQLITLWLSLLILGGLSFLILQLPPVRAWLWQQTGEEEFLAQVKGLTDLLSDRLRPPLSLAADVAIVYVDVNPFGINAFLEQEVEPAKRILAIQMAAGATSRIAVMNPIARRGRNMTTLSPQRKPTTWN